MTEFDKPWSEQFGGLAELKTYYREPYCKAIAPWVASIVHLIGAPRTNILVLGGGNGHFSRELLPAIHKILLRTKGPTDLNVVETDVDSHIKQTIPDAVVIDAKHLTDVFPPGYFHVAIGESMIHQLGKDIPIALSQINRVLVPGGAFIHVQDAVPDPRYWLSRETKKTGILDVLNQGERHIIDPQNIDPDLMFLREHVMKEAHDNLSKVLAQTAKVSRLNIGTLTVTGSHDVQEKQAIHPAGIGGNSHRYVFGTQYYEHLPALQKGTRRLEYTGAVTIMSQRPMADFEKSFTSKNFEYRP